MTSARSRLRADRFRVPRLSQEVVLFLFVLALAVAFGAYESVFWSGVNLQNVSRQGAVLTMVAVGEIFPILIGGIDLSVGGQVSMLSIFAVELSHHVPVPLAFLITIGRGWDRARQRRTRYLRADLTDHRHAWHVADHGWLSRSGTRRPPCAEFSDAYRALGANNVWFIQRRRCSRSAWSSSPGSY